MKTGLAQQREAWVRCNSPEFVARRIVELERERDEARAEVERLRGVVKGATDLLNGIETEQVPHETWLDSRDQWLAELEPEGGDA